MSPFPKTLTEASCPALSSSTVEATISSSVSAVPARSLIRSSAGRSRLARISSRTRSAKSVAARTASSTTAGDGSTSYIRTIACDQSRSEGAYDAGTPSSSAITSTGNGSA